MITQTFNKTLSFGLSLMLTLMSVLALPAQAQNSKAWTTAASAGVVDDQDVNKVNTTGLHVVQLAVGGAGASSSATLRYNVTATEGLFTPFGVPRMRVRFADNGGNSQVRVRLYRVHLDSGATNQMLELNSNSFAAGAGFQTQTTAPCEAVYYSFDFTNYAYFIEAQLSRTNFGGAPKLAGIQVYSQVQNACQGAGN